MRLHPEQPSHITSYQGTYKTVPGGKEVPLHTASVAFPGRHNSSHLERRQAGYDQSLPGVLLNIYYLYFIY